jgi:hypothetical protein
MHGTLTSADFRYCVPPPGCAGGVAGAGCPPAGAGVAGEAGTGTAGGFAGAGCGVGEGAPGNVVSPPPSEPGVSGADERVAFATSASEIDVVMKIVARMTVVRVNAFAAPRPVINPPTPPPEPKPRPPPSERCKRMTPIIATQTTIWIVNRTGNNAVIGAGSSKRGAKVLRPQEGAVCSRTCPR